MSEEAPEVTDITDELIAERRVSDYSKKPDGMNDIVWFLIRWIDTISLWIGRIVCVATIPLFSVMVYEVFMRYVFIAPTVWVYDISRMIFGAMFMLGAGYALSKGVHIRADFLYRNFSVKTQGTVDACLYLFFYFPGMLVFLWMALDFAGVSWVRLEKGMDTAWMPIVAPIKSALPLGVFFLIMQGISEFLKSVHAATRGKWPV